MPQFTQMKVILTFYRKLKPRIVARSHTRQHVQTTVGLLERSTVCMTSRSFWRSWTLPLLDWKLVYRHIQRSLPLVPVET